jgi:hypothetical protein
MGIKDVKPYRSKRINPYLEPTKLIGTGTPPSSDIPKIDTPLLQPPGGGGGGVSKTVLEEPEERRKRVNPYLPEEQGPIALPPAIIEPETKAPAIVEPETKTPAIVEPPTVSQPIRTMFETHSGVKKEPAPIGAVGQMFPDGTFKVLPGDQGLDTRGDWAEPLRSLFDPRDRPGRRLLVIACCATKTDDPGEIPALERYAGTLFQTLKSKGIPDDVDVAILSAEHGLIRTDYPLSEYDIQMTPGKKQELLQNPKFTQLVKGTLGGLGGMNGYKDVLIAGGKDYRDTIIEAHNSGVRIWKSSETGKDMEYGNKGDWIPKTDRPYWITETKGRGIGDQRQQLGEWLEKSYYDPSEEGVVIETPKSLEPPTTTAPEEPTTAYTGFDEIRGKSAELTQAQWNEQFMEEIHKLDAFQSDDPLVNSLREMYFSPEGYHLGSRAYLQQPFKDSFNATEILPFGSGQTFYRGVPIEDMVGAHEIGSVVGIDEVFQLQGKDIRLDPMKIVDSTLEDYDDPSESFETREELQQFIDDQWLMYQYPYPENADDPFTATAAANAWSRYGDGPHQLENYFKALAQAGIIEHSPTQAEIEEKEKKDFYAAIRHEEKLEEKERRQERRDPAIKAKEKRPDFTEAYRDLIDKSLKKYSRGYKEINVPFDRIDKDQEERGRLTFFRGFPIRQFKEWSNEKQKYVTRYQIESPAPNDPRIPSDLLRHSFKFKYEPVRKIKELWEDDPKRMQTIMDELGYGFFSEDIETPIIYRGVHIRRIPAKTARETGHTRTISTWRGVDDKTVFGYTRKEIQETIDAKIKRGDLPDIGSPIKKAAGGFIDKPLYERTL